MKQTIAFNLKRLRKQNGNLRQKEVAGAIGIKVARYRSYELGYRVPSVLIIDKIRDYYHLSSVDFIIKAVSI